MTHLGDRLAALVDGELDHDARDRALAHVARCAQCRAAIEVERRVKALVTTASAPAVPVALTARLLALAEPGDPLPPRGRTMPGGHRRVPLPAPGRTSPAGAHPSPYGVPERPPVLHRRGRAATGRRSPRLVRAGVLTAGAFCLVGMVLGTAFWLGGPASAPAGSSLLPPVDSFSLEHAATSGELPLSDPALGVVQVSGVRAGVTGSLPLAPAPLAPAWSGPGSAGYPVVTSLTTGGLGGSAGVLSPELPRR